MDPITIAAAAVALSGLGGALAQWRSKSSAQSIQAELDAALVDYDAVATTDHDSSSLTAAKAATTHRSSQATIRVLNKFSAQGLAQSQLSFFCSIVFAALGFMIIVAGVGFAIFQPDNTAQSALIPVIGGAVVEAVSALFFSVNIRAQKVVTSYFDKTREDRRLEEALTLADNIGDPHMSARLKSILAMKFVGMDDLPALFERVVHANAAGQAKPSTTASGNGAAPAVADGSALISTPVAVEKA